MSAHPFRCIRRNAVRLQGLEQAQLTEIIDVEDAADGTARPAVSDLAL